MRGAVVVWRVVVGLLALVGAFALVGALGGCRLPAVPDVVPWRAAPGVTRTPCRRVPVTVVGDGDDALPPHWQALLDSAAVHGDSIEVCHLYVDPDVPRQLRAGVGVQSDADA